MKKDEKLAISWCDNGTVDSLFMDGIIETMLALPKLDIQLGHLNHLIGGQIAKQRQALIEDWYATGIDWLLWVDSDVVLTPNILQKLWETADKNEKPVVCGIYFIATNPNTPMMQPVPCIFTDDGYVSKPVHPLPYDSIIPVDTAGLGLTLMHRSVIDKLKQPYEGIYFDIEVGRSGKGEDISFFRKLKEQGIPVYAHTGAVAQHLKRFIYDENYYRFWWNAAEQDNKQQ